MVHQKDLAHGDMELHPCYYHRNLSYENMQVDDRVGGDEKLGVRFHEELQLEKDNIQGNVRYVQAYIRGEEFLGEETCKLEY